jgi:hypothetical protein
MAQTLFPHLPASKLRTLRAKRSGPTVYLFAGGVHVLLSLEFRLAQQLQMNFVGALQRHVRHVWETLAERTSAKRRALF